MYYPEHDYAHAESHLILSGTRDSARTLADMLYDWSKLDPASVEGAGRYAARGALR